MLEYRSTIFNFQAAVISNFPSKMYVHKPEGTTDYTNSVCISVTESINVVCHEFPQADATEQ